MLPAYRNSTYLWISKIYYLSFLLQSFDALFIISVFWGFLFCGIISFCEYTLTGFVYLMKTFPWNQVTDSNYTTLLLSCCCLVKVINIMPCSLSSCYTFSHLSKKRKAEDYCTVYKHRPIFGILVHLLRHLNTLFECKMKHQKLEMLVKLANFLKRYDL